MRAYLKPITVVKLKLETAAYQLGSGILNRKPQTAFLRNPDRTQIETILEKIAYK